MSCIDKHVPKINIFEFLKSHRVNENGQSTFVSVISVSMSDKGTDVPAATCLFIVNTGHCSLNSATCHTWFMKSANFLWYSSIHS
jgi:hypothetical protein